MNDMPTPKRGRRTKESFDEERDQITLRVEEFHISNHDGSGKVSQEDMNKALLKFVVTSGQPINLVDDPRFINFMESFRKLAIDANDAKSTKTAKDFLPSRNTLRKRIDDRLDKAKDEVVSKLELLKTHGGGITMDFAKKGVDYIAMTGHFIDKDWLKQYFVLSFSPVKAGARKTSQFVQELVSQELRELGIGRHDLLHDGRKIKRLLCRWQQSYALPLPYRFNDGQAFNSPVQRFKAKEESRNL